MITTIHTKQNQCDLRKCIRQPVVQIDLMLKTLSHDIVWSCQL